MPTMQEIVNDAIAKHKDDIEAACRLAKRRIRHHVEYESFVDELVTRAVQAMVYDARHKSNLLIRRTNCEAKVVVGESSIVNDVARAWFDYYIDAKTLGSVMGKELRTLAATEAERAIGHTFNRLLLEQLAVLVPEEKAVRDAVSESRIQSIADDVRRSLSSGGQTT